MLQTLLSRETRRARSLVREEELTSIATPRTTTTKTTRAQERLLRAVLSTVCVIGACGMLRPESVLDSSVCCFRLLSIDRRVKESTRVMSHRVLKRMVKCCPEMVWHAGTQVFGCRLLREDSGSRDGNRRFRDVVISSETKTTKMWENARKWWSEFLQVRSA